MSYKPVIFISKEHHHWYGKLDDLNKQFQEKQIEQDASPTPRSNDTYELHSYEGNAKL